MNPWNTYQSRMNARGQTRRETVFSREGRYLRAKMPASLSFHHLIIDDCERELAVINSDNLDTKTLCSLPGEDIRHGAYVQWMDNFWLVTEKDANNELYTKAKMRQCNYLLKWVNKDNQIIQRWCIIEDGTKYLTGEYGDKDYIVVRGDSRVSMILPRDKETICLKRESRFLIDDYDSSNVLAYRLTKPFKLGGAYNSNGVLSFVLTECDVEDADNLELHIANYYNHFPRNGELAEPLPPDTHSGETDGKKRWY